MNTNALRKLFLEYFKQSGHEVVPSSSLVPYNDPTLLFTNAGMVQFKDTFLGLEKRGYQRATTSQKCVRAGGKHNDLENVGYTARHHTFFEMLGNFSFGDYFKKEAIQFAWQFLTEILNLPAERLWVTVYEEDTESESIWLKEIKIDPTRFSRCGVEDNFWAMGETGPCGPCTEIYYDHGPSIAGGPPGSLTSEGDRYVEIWNLVFMQYNRDEKAVLNPLPKPSVDTGMGIERIAAVLQGVHSNYDIDIFKNLIAAIAKLGNISDLTQKSLRVIADHIRSSAFLIADGVIPSNEGRGYVLRRIMRRAIRHGHRLGFKESFFYKLVQPLAKEMGDAYPELISASAQIEKVIEQEEQQFAKTLDQGLKILEQDITQLIGKVISGETVFKLYDTYGFPVDLTADIARERQLEVDIEGFNIAMATQRARAREASTFSVQYEKNLNIENVTNFIGYETLENTATIVTIFQDDKPVEEISAGMDGIIVLDHTPFYAEAGGQVGDEGILELNNNRFIVKNTRKVQDAHLHIGKVLVGTFKIGDKINAVVDIQKRNQTALNHSATHLLHAALRKVIGEHIQQKGSLVEPERLRFDYTHFEALTREEIYALEHLVNEKIRENTEVITQIMPIEEAKKTKAMALFGEKYGKNVRVLHMGHNFSVELCGGTHVKRTGDIGLFKIIAEYGIASGVRRIEAITGEKAVSYIESIQKQWMNAAEILKCTPDTTLEKITVLTGQVRQLEKALQQIKTELMHRSSAGSGDIAEQAREIKGIKVLVAKMAMGDPKSLRDAMDRLKSKLGKSVIVLSAVENNKVSLVVGVSKDCTDKVLAGDLVNFVAKQVGGQGGGRPDMAQAGGNDPTMLEEALESVYAWLEARL